MLSLLFAICLILCVVFGMQDEDYAIAPGIIAFIFLIPIVVGISILATSSRYDAQIEMYQEENIVLETKIDNAVSIYLDHEGLVYDMDKLDATTVLVVLPELNGNELVKQQVETYISNSSKIKELKERKINLSIWKFLVYFGN